MPHVVLVAQGGIVPAGLPQQAPEIADGPPQAGRAGIRRKQKAAVRLRLAFEQRQGAVPGAVVLHEHAKILFPLGAEGSQQRRQVLFPVVAGQQHLRHHFHPHLWKYWHMERTCRRFPRRVRVFSRAQA